MSILLLIDGPIGAGKSTVSNILSQKYGFKHLNIDDLKTPFK
jgi:cytidylate kinase